MYLKRETSARPSLTRAVMGSSAAGRSSRAIPAPALKSTAEPPSSAPATSGAPSPTSSSSPGTPWPAPARPTPSSASPVTCRATNSPSRSTSISPQSACPWCQAQAQSRSSRLTRCWASTLPTPAAPSRSNFRSRPSRPNTSSSLALGPKAPACPMLTTTPSWACSPTRKAACATSPTSSLPSSTCCPSASASLSEPCSKSTAGATCPKPSPPASPPSRGRSSHHPHFPPHPGPLPLGEGEGADQWLATILPRPRRGGEGRGEGVRPVSSPSPRCARPRRAIPPPKPPLYPLYSPSKPLVSPFYIRYRGFTRGVEGV